jgi:peptidoglycan/LPS O-acetylase OafA/YrhL
MRSESFSQAKLLRLGRWAVVLTIIPIAWIFSRGVAARGQQSIFVYTLLAITFGGLIARALSPAATVWSRFLRLPVLQYIGKISYGLYLVHKLAFVVYEKSPLYSALSVAGSPRLNTAIAVVAEVSFAILMASLSWYLFETPILKLKRYFEGSGKPSVLVAEAAATV